MDSPTPGFSFGMRMNCVREDLHLTKTAMAKALHIAPSTLTSYENNNTFPSMKTMRLFCKLYNVNEEWLMTNEGPIFLDKNIDNPDEQILKDTDLRKRTIDILANDASSREDAENMVNQME